MSLTLTYEIKAADDQTLLLNFLKKQDISKKPLLRRNIVVEIWK